VQKITRIGDQIMTMATTTIRISIETLPDHLDRRRPNVVAEVV
jgi:hypothetical protein